MAQFKDLKILKNIKIEEYTLIGVSVIMLFMVFFLDFFNTTSLSLLKNGWVNIKEAMMWWGGGMFMLIFFYIIFKFYVFCVNITSDFFLNKTSRHFSFSIILNREVKFRFKQIWFLIKPLVIILIPASLSLLILGILYNETKNRLINLQLLDIDKFLTGNYPFLWLHSFLNPFKNFLDFLTPVIIPSFLALSVIMGILIFVFYFDRNEKLFKGYIIASFIVLLLAQPLWYLFPANSPVNAFLYNSDRTGLNLVLSQEIKNYHPNLRVGSFQEEMWENQKNALPISTMPSMHWAWALIIVYYLFKKRGRTVFFSLPWLFLTLLGSVYLGCHYLIDGVVALFLVVLSILLANFLVKIEKRYYNEDIQEIEFKEKVKKEILKPFEQIIRLFSDIRFQIKT